MADAIAPLSGHLRVFKPLRWAAPACRAGRSPESPNVPRSVCLSDSGRVAPSAAHTPGRYALSPAGRRRGPNYSAALPAATTWRRVRVRRFFWRAPRGTGRPARAPRWCPTGRPNTRWRSAGPLGARPLPIRQRSNSASTGAWSDGRSRARGAASMMQRRQRSASAALQRIWSMRRPQLRSKPFRR
jgi:hypothetical protein